MSRLLMEPTPQVLGPRDSQPRGQGVDTSKVFGGHVSDQHVGHRVMISPDITYGNVSDVAADHRALLEAAKVQSDTWRRVPIPQAA